MKGRRFQVKETFQQMKRETFQMEKTSLRMDWVKNQNDFLVPVDIFLKDIVPGVNYDFPKRSS